MCITCKPIRAYKNIDSYTKLSIIRASATSLVDKGIFELIFEFNETDHDYQESQYLCKDCGKVHVLWLQSCLCASGGEWRQISAS